MPKILVLSILALTSGLMLNAAQQVHQQNVANVAEVRAKARPVPDTPQPDSSLDDTLRWIQQKLPAPFEVDVQAGGHLSETVPYSTVLVDWKGCSVHFRSERNHTLNGEIDKHTVEQIIPLRDVDPSRTVPVASARSDLGCTWHQYFDLVRQTHHRGHLPSAAPEHLLHEPHVYRRIGGFGRFGAPHDCCVAACRSGLWGPPRHVLSSWRRQESLVHESYSPNRSSEPIG
jgi:hypothetical protein